MKAGKRSRDDERFQPKKKQQKGKDEIPPQRRRIPVTTPIQDQQESEDEEEGDEPIFGEENDDDIEMDGPTNVEGENKQRTSNTQNDRKQQKALLQARKAQKQHSSLISDAKRLWIRAQQKSLKKDERNKSIKELMGCVKGHVQDIVFKHDASRIIQTIIKHGSKPERAEVAKELVGRYRELAQNKYAKFIVTKIARLCPEQRPVIVQEFKGYILRLVVHREAGKVIADIYELYTNAYERAVLARDFYGKEVALFEGSTETKNVSKNGKVPEVSEEEKNKLKQGLAAVLEGAEEEKKKRILTAVKENIDIVLDNPEKGAISFAIFHHVLLEYLQAIATLVNEEEREKLRRDIFEGCQEILAEMVHTKDGSRVVREFLARGTAKDRKQIVKVLKPHIERICLDDDAQLVLFTALDVIDDTKLTTKSLLTPILSYLTTPSNLKSFYTSSAGRRSLLYPLLPPSSRSRHFMAETIRALEEAENIAKEAGTSKKDKALRKEEVGKGWGEGLIRSVAAGGEKGVEEILRDPGGCLLVGELMLYGDGDKSSPTAALLHVLSQPYPTSDPSIPHIIDIPPASRFYKTLLQGGHYSQSTRSVQRASDSSFSPLEFARAWKKNVGEEKTLAIARGDGAFVIAALCERVKEEGTKEEREALKKWFGKDLRADLDASEGRGRKVLLEAIDAL